MICQKANHQTSLFGIVILVTLAKPPINIATMKKPNNVTVVERKIHCAKKKNVIQMI